MRKSAYVLCVALLGGCSGVYDEEAIPSASAARAVASAQCDAGLLGKTIVGARAYAECRLSAVKTFATAIKLRKMDIYEAYATRVRLAAAQAEAGTVTGSQFLDAADAAGADFASQLFAADQIDQRRRARAAGALAAFGQSMQNQAAINAINRPRTCTTTGFGNTATATCY